MDRISLEDAARLKGLPYQTLKKRLQRARVILHNDPLDARRKRVDISILSGSEMRQWLQEQVSSSYALLNSAREPAIESPEQEKGIGGLDSRLRGNDGRPREGGDPTSTAPLARAARSLQPLLPFARPTGQEAALAGVPLKYQSYIDLWMKLLGEVQNGNWTKYEGHIINGCTIRTRDDMIRAVAPQYKTSLSGFYRVQRLLTDIEKDPAIPDEKKWGFWVQRMIPKPRPGRASAAFFVQPENLWMMGKLRDLWLNQARFSVAAAHRLLLEEIDSRQRAQGLRHLYDKPTLSQCRTALAQISAPEITLARQGAKAYNDKCAACLSRDPESLAANDLWVTDQKEIDVRLRDGGERLGRIWLVSFMDVASERILGYAFGPILSSEIVMMAAAMALERAGVPRAVHMDLGKEFTCRAFNGAFRKISGHALYEDAEGLWNRLNVQIVKAIGRNPQSKTIERQLHNNMVSFERTVPGFCGRNPDERPETLAAAEAQHELWKSGKAPGTPLITIGDLIGRFIHWVENAWNGRARGRGKMRRGMTPLEAWNVKQPAAGIRTLTPDELDHYTADHRFVKIARGGQVNLTFFGCTIEYQAAELFLHQGEDVEVIVSRRTFQKVSVFLAGQLLCEAQAKPLYDWLPEDREQLRAAMRCKAALNRIVRRGLEAGRALDAADHPVALLEAAPEIPGARQFGNAVIPAPLSFPRKRESTPPRITSSDLAQEILALEEEQP